MLALNAKIVTPDALHCHTLGLGCGVGLYVRAKGQLPLVAADKGNSGTSEAGRLGRSLAVVGAAPTVLMIASPADTTGPSRRRACLWYLPQSARMHPPSTTPTERAKTAAIGCSTSISPKTSVSTPRKRTLAPTPPITHGINKGARHDDDLLTALAHRIYVIKGKLASRRLLSSCSTPGIALSSKSRWFINADFTTSGVLPK